MPSNLPANFGAQLLIGSRHQFELIRIPTKASYHHHLLSGRGFDGIDSLKLLSIPTTDASAIGAIEATEVRLDYELE